MKMQICDALFSPDRQYRYWLTRIWENQNPLCAFIGLNPSTADETKDDPTIRRCIRFAHDWGFGGLIMLNLFALRSTDPKALYTLGVDPVGKYNDRHLVEYSHLAGRVVCAWGEHGRLCDRGSHVKSTLKAHRIPLHSFGKTKAGEPKHPLYLRANAPLYLT